MRFNFASLTLAFAAITSVFAEAITPSPISLAPREEEAVRNAIASLDHYTLYLKRDEMDPAELAKRENAIVTEVLTAVNNTQLAPGVLLYFIKDPTLSKIAINVIVYSIKNDLINFNTLLKALNDSGLAVDVIQSVISNCQFYREIYKLVLEELANLPSIIAGMLHLSSTKVSTAMAKREIMVPSAPVPIYTRDTQDLVTSLMESLKNSGLANQVVNALIVEDQFYTFGADLIQQLIQEDALDYKVLLQALLQSGLIESIFKEFLKIDTLKTIMVNALAAAFNKCQSTPNTSAVSTTSGTATPAITTGGATDPTPTPTTITTGGGSKPPTTTTLAGGAVVICNWVKKT
ncbi:uncharacterized protein J8A68_004704 [[Candida] subhashii]|uniref:Opaque-phase-specific protein OP4 n=1 Tax=[Candida] subhashii TaxID=561895 RepID=A0A8J5UK86_9ASCO|nr:uncharacterized protein J8A68_004704 [[Candida] subhashii]KAG7661756.1 hypothetical protein J8A68_004704 [[Candida] subhashii]